MTQFLIEEALYDRLEFEEKRSHLSGLPEELLEEEPSLHEQLGARHQRLMQGAQ